MLFYLFFLFMFACRSSLRPLYEQERMETMKTITDTPNEDWSADMRISISYRSLSELTKKMLQQKINKGAYPVDVLGQKIDVLLTSNIKSLKLSSGGEDTLEVEITLDGNVELKHDLLGFSNPYSAKLLGTLQIDVDENKLQARANRIKNIEITTKRMSKIKVSKVITDWLNKQLANIPSQEIMTLELSNLSARAVRFTGNRHSLDIEALSYFPQTTPLPPQKKHPRGDWEMQISNEAISQIVRQQTFSLPPVKNHHIDIKKVSVKNKTLKAELRLWKLDGKGDWWRDYEIEAKISTKKKEIILTDPEVKQLEKSPGAGLADPLSLFGEKIILNEIKKQIQYKLPKEKSTSFSENQLVLNINGIMGLQEHIMVFGTIDTKEKSSKPKRRRRRK